jgi:hypothetical protein
MLDVVRPSQEFLAAIMKFGRVRVGARRRGGHATTRPWKKPRPCSVVRAGRGLELSSALTVQAGLSSTG